MAQRVGLLKRTVGEFRADNLTDWAAALTYYGVLALFPALVALVSIVGFLGNTGQTIFSIVKWPAILLVVSFMFSLLFYVAPNVRQRGFKWITPGACVAVVVWLLASAAFALYVKNFGKYDKTYGSLAGVIV